MAWIKIENCTPDKPEVIRLASILGIDQDAVVGKLVRIWIWADLQTYDGNAKGNAPSVTKSFLDRCAYCPGFGAALAEVGWLHADGDLMTFPNFERHNGQTAKQRALTAKRVAECRSKGNAEGNGASVSGALPPALPEKSRVEESKSRVEETRKGADATLPPPAGGEATAPPVIPVVKIQYPPDFESWWMTYPRREGKKVALASWERAVGILSARFIGTPFVARRSAIGWLLDAASDYAASPLVKTSGHQLTPHPATWLNQGRYDDDRAAWQRERINGERNGRPPQGPGVIYDANAKGGTF